MKRVTCWILFAALALTLSACGGGQQYTPALRTTAQEGTKPPAKETMPSTTAVHTEPATEPGDDLKGIIYVDRGLKFKDDPYSSVDIMVWYGDLTVNVLDPETGATRVVRSFPVEKYDTSYKTTSPMEYYNGYYNGFDKNFERLALEFVMPDKSQHVGWLDTKGNLTDVTQKITVPGGDWSGTVSQSWPYFDPDGYFGFMDKDGEHRVPVDDLRPEAVEDVAERTRQNPDGGVDVGNFGAWKKYYANEKMVYGIQPKGDDELIRTKQMDWINDTDYVYVSERNEENLNHQYTLRRVNKGKEPIYLTPFIRDRWSYNPVVSPDGTQIVFLSSLRSSDDKKGYVFIVSATGGTPTRLKTDLSFFCREIEPHFVDWR